MIRQYTQYRHLARRHLCYQGGYHPGLQASTVVVVIQEPVSLLGLAKLGSDFSIARGPR